MLVVIPVGLMVELKVDSLAELLAGYWAVLTVAY